jgi:hypothetical protein
MVTHADFDAMMKRVAFIDKPNVFSERQTLAGGATDGEGNAYATTKDVAIDLNNGLSTKVTDNKNGTEQLNGVKIQPFNKLSDTIGGRNLLINTSISSTNRRTTLQGASYALSSVYSRTDSYEQLTALSDGELFYRFMGPDTNNLYGLTPGETYTLSGSASHTSGVLDFRAQYSTDRSSWNNLGFTTTTGNDLEIPVSDGSVFTPFSHTFTIPVGATGVYFSLEDFGYTTDGLFRFKNMKLEKGSVATDWTPAPEDKVSVSDMRKPANDVAGIEEVNAKQDKIGYTPADDSKVVHDNHDGTFSINGNSFTPAVLDSAKDINSQPTHTDVDTLTKPGLYYVSGSAPNNPFKANMMLENRIQYNWDSFEEVQIAYRLQYISGIAIRYVRPNSSLTGGNFDPWVFLSDDSKVAHLSGANNFDTVPTVNNNPLLLASSLPSDLARTGSDQEFTGKNTFDTAPIDKATGNPYITKDGVPAVPSTLADTTKDANFTGKLQKSGIDVATKSDVTTAVSTATANMVDSTKATNFTAGLKSGGVDVATAADLKSVADSAWRLMTLPDVSAVENMHMLYKVDKTNSLLYIVLGGTYKSVVSDDDGLLVADLSTIVKGISGVNIVTNNSYDFVYENDYYSNQITNTVSFGYSGTKLMLKSPYTDRPLIKTPDGTDLYIKYGSNIKYTDLV